MRRYLLDTGVVGAYMNRRQGIHLRVKNETSRGNRIGIGFPVIGELFAGVELSDTRERNLRKLKKALSTFALWPFDLKAAAEYGRLFALMRRLGRPIQQVDIQVAAIANSLGNCTVVSADADFIQIPDLDVEDWTK